MIRFTEIDFSEAYNLAKFQEDTAGAYTEGLHLAMAMPWNKVMINLTFVKKALC